MPTTTATKGSAPRQTGYTQYILDTLATSQLAGASIDPRHVEAYMRLEHSTLDGLSAWQFDAEVMLAVECIRVGGIEDAEALALSFGL